MSSIFKMNADFVEESNFDNETCNKIATYVDAYHSSTEHIHPIDINTIEKLTRFLHETLLIIPKNIFNEATFMTQNLHYRNRLGRHGKRKVAIICHVLARIFSKMNKNFVVSHRMNWDLIASLRQIFKFFARTHVKFMNDISKFTLIESIGLTKYVLLSSSNNNEDIMLKLLELIKTNEELKKISSNHVQFHSTCVIARFSAMYSAKNHIISTQVIKKSNIMIEILCTAAPHVNDTNIIDIIDGLIELTEISTIRRQMINRECIIPIITNQLYSSNTNIKRKALKLTQTLVKCHNEKVDTYTAFHANSHLIKASLIQSLLEENETSLQIYIIFLLNDTICKNILNLVQTLDVMDIFFELSISNEVSEAVLIESSISFIQAAGKFITSTDVLTKVIHYITNPFSKVRAKTLWLLKDICYLNSDSIQNIIEETDIIERFGYILLNGSENDCFETVQICKKLLLLNIDNHKLICSNQSLLQGLIQLIMKDKIDNKEAYKCGIDVILKLLQNESCIPYFLNYTNLLPWLVRMANRTCDEQFKDDLIQAIILFTGAILNKAKEQEKQHYLLK